LTLFDDSVGTLLQLQRHIEAQRLGGLEIDDQLMLCRRFHGKVGWLCAFEDAVDIRRRLTKLFDEINTITDQAA
jgi:hypothetical protein